MLRNKLQEYQRCEWCEKDDLYRTYHDTEWGTPNYEDSIFFEFLILEGFQAGLSWYTILKRRENFRHALDNFDYRKIAHYTPEKIESLMHDEGIVRNRLKINATVNNARHFMKIQEEWGSFSNYIWSFTDHKIIDKCPKSVKEIPATDELSDKISKDLKKRGFKFVGSTIIYAFLQAMGIINDHTEYCLTRKK